MATLAGWVRKRHALPEHEIDHDLRKLDIARIAIGAFATGRYGLILSLALSNGSYDIVLVAGVATGLSLLVMLGVATPVALLLLMSSANILIDNALGASTLGTMVLSIALLLFLLAPAGRTLSIDSLLHKGNGTFAWGVDAMYRFFGSVSADRILIAKLAALLAYYCLCLYSISWHIHDEAWTSGLVINWVLLSPASNPHFVDLAWDAYQAAPWFFVNFCRLAIVGMAFWYVLLLPGLFLGAIVRYFIILWGIAFFLISTFVLPLSYLGWYELIFWFAVFATGPVFGSNETKKLSVLFDDRCNLCDRTVKTLSWFDIFGRLVFMPIHRNMVTAEKFGVSLEEGLTDLVGIEEATGKRYDGYRLYETVAARVFLLWPAWPVLWLGRKLWIGPAVYRFIADRRTRLFGVCEFSTIPDKFSRFGHSKNIDPQSGAPAYSAAIHAVLVTLVVLSTAFLLRLPTFTTAADEIAPGRWAASAFGAAPLGFGIGKINVFNESDLALFTLRFSATMQPSLDMPEGNVLTKPLSSPHLFNMSDRQRYFIIKHARRMSRMNLGCDMDFWRDVSPMYVESLLTAVQVVPYADLVVTIGKVSWPSAKDLESYTALSPDVYDLCHGRIDIETGNLISLEFDQNGVDRALRRMELPEFLKSDSVLVALNYPCLADAGWLNTLIDTDGELLRQSEFVASSRELLVSRYGEFQINCLFRTIAIMQAQPDLDLYIQRNASPSLCQAGVALVEALAEAATPDKNLYESVGALRTSALEAQERGETNLCIRSAASARQLYFEHILKPESYNVWQQRTANSR
ncbi:hypothetical protein Plav_3315 [Parvibaculum lavamentivorans DS-1]|uniref:Uncharacterized protein n=1 Tax=Parvibaculum lavamentivorans (strain DS-1 / DSM 13023 / NCIMB 13966) TaxID=402881 RepID=A7HYD6_PARL1|nr:DUF393 domain-containing protein [Parvibaculum lavamentivorans]ABS64919.1 hypothetical protein Plav_3315 [Parvibaculum lavamentivorans DS-1]